MPISEEEFRQLSEKGKIIGRQDPNSVTGRAFAILRKDIAMTADEVITAMEQDEGYVPKKTVKRVLNNLCKNLVRVKNTKVKKVIKRYLVQEGKGVAYFIVNPAYVSVLEKDKQEEQLQQQIKEQRKQRKSKKKGKKKRKR